MLQLTINAYFTRRGDTLRKLARDLFGRDCSRAQLQKRMDAIIADNNSALDPRNPFHGWSSLEKHPGQADRVLPPHRTFFLPGSYTSETTGNPILCEAHIKDQAHRTLRTLNHASAEQRSRLTQYIDDGMSPTTLVAVNKVFEGLLAATVGMGVALRVPNTIVEKYTEEFKERQLKLWHKIERVEQDYRAYDQTPMGGEKVSARGKFIESYKDMQRYFQKEVQRTDRFLNRRFRMGTLRDLPKPGNYAYANRRYGFRLNNSRDAQALLKSVSKAKLIARGTWAVDIALGAANVGLAYEDGKDWEKALAVVLAEIGGSALGGYVGGALVTALVASPIGWIVILSGTAGALIGGALTEYGIDKTIG